MKKLAIYGAAFFDIIKLIDAINKVTPTWEILGFIDDTLAVGGTYYGYRILGNRSILPDLVIQDVYVVNNVSGNCKKIKMIGELIDSHGCKVPNLIHPSIDMSYVTLGHGCLLPEGCTVGGHARLGNYVIVRLGSIISHDVDMGSYIFIGPGCTISGKVQVDDGVFIGTGATIMNDRRLGSYSTIGAGSVVTKDVLQDTTVVGVPAKPYMKEDNS